MKKKSYSMLLILLLLVVGCQNPSKTESEAILSPTTDSITYQPIKTPQPIERPDENEPTSTDSVAPVILPIPDAIGKVFSESVIKRSKLYGSDRYFNNNLL